MLKSDPTFYEETLAFTGVIFIDCYGGEWLKDFPETIDVHRNIVKLLDSITFDISIIATYGGVTDPLILNYPVRERHYIRELAGRNTQLAPALNKPMFENTNWLVCGASWKICLHNCDIGFVNLKTISQINIIAHVNGVGTCNRNPVPMTKQHFEDDDLTWAVNKDGFYKLI
jgi:hypothetical protein